MQTPSNASRDSHALRLSLKRGLARQAFVQAGRDDADLPGLLAMGSTLRPNAKAEARLATRLMRQPGVVRVRRAPATQGLVVIARMRIAAQTVSEGEIQFAENSLLYTRIGIDAHTASVRLDCLSFCLHAVERLIERARLPRDEALLPRVDSEAVAALAALNAGHAFEDSGDLFVPALSDGLWAASRDRVTLDGCSALKTPVLQVPLISFRTFLAPDQMKPTLWLRWRDDPTCRLVAA